MSEVAKIIVLIGQSNAVGVGYAKYLSNHFKAEKVNEFLGGYENVKINFYSHDFASNGFKKTTVGCTELTKKTVGPEVGIAEKLNEDFANEKFYIVKYAIGGTNLYDDWRSPSSLPTTEQGNLERGKTGWCYNNFVKLLSESIELLKKDNLIPEIRALCWMQGESDSEEIDNVKNYTDRFNKLIKDFENTFGAYIKKYIIADGGVSPSWKYYKEMNMAKELNAKSKNNIKYIDTIKEGLSTLKEPIELPDIYHYDVDSIIKLGNLFEQAIKENLR